MTLKGPEYSVKGQQCTVITAAQPTYGSLLIWVSSSGSRVSKILCTFFSPPMFSCSSRLRHPQAQLAPFKVLDVWTPNFVSNIERNMAKPIPNTFLHVIVVVIWQRLQPWVRGRKYRITGNSDSARSWRQQSGTGMPRPQWSTCRSQALPYLHKWTRTQDPLLLVITFSQPEWCNPLLPVTKASDLEEPTLIQKPLRVDTDSTRIRKSFRNDWYSQPLSILCYCRWLAKFT